MVDVITSDLEVFPVRTALLRPCIALTAVVQSGRGKYKRQDQDQDQHQEGEQGQGQRLAVAVNVDCCTFDRVLLYLQHEYRSAHAQARGQGQGQGQGQWAGWTLRAAEKTRTPREMPQGLGSELGLEQEPGPGLKQARIPRPRQT